MSRGYIDPSIRPTNDRQTKLLELIQARGLTLRRLHRDGRSLRLTGPDGLHLTVADLSSLELSDVTPRRPQRR